MKIISRKRMTGRTTELANLAVNDPDSKMVVLSVRARNSVRERFPELKGKVITARQIESVRGTKYTLYIDDIDYLTAKQSNDILNNYQHKIAVMVIENKL